MEVASKELFRRHKVSVSAALVPRRHLCPGGIIRTGESVFTPLHKLGLRGIQTFFFIYIFYHYPGIDSQIKAVGDIVPETLLSYIRDPPQNKQLYMSLQEYGLFWLRGN